MPCRKARREIILAAVVGGSCVASAAAATKSWAAPVSDNWTTAAAWAAAGAPANGDAAFINFPSASNYLVNYDNPSTTQLFTILTLNNAGGGASQLRTAAAGAVYNVSNAIVGGTGLGHWQIGNATANLGSLNIATGPAGTGTVTLSTGTVTASRVTVGNAGTGFLTQSNGVLQAGTLVISAGVASHGTYTLAGGALAATVIDINSNGTLNITGGIASGTTLNLNTGGTLVRSGLGFGFDTVNQSGGTVATNFFVNGDESYVYNAGSFLGTMDTVGTVTFNGDMTMANGWDNRAPSQTIPAGRTITLGGQGLNQLAGTMFLAGNLNTPTTDVGGLTAGSAPVFSQQGGIHTVTGALRLGAGASSGTYNLNAGTLNVTSALPNALSIGTDFQGQLNLVNGRANINFLRIGDGAVGTLNHSGGGDYVGIGMVVGNTAQGTYIQNNVGASVSASSLTIAAGANTAGSRYNMLNGTLTLSGPMVNNAFFTQFGGRATMQAVSGSGRMDITGTSSLTVSSIRQTLLYVADTARVFTRPNGGPAGVSRLGSLFFEDFEQLSFFGRWDLTNNDLVLDYTAPSPLNDTFKYIQSGYNFGAWTGTGLNSSHAAAATGPATALGYAEASEVFFSFPAQFSGETVDSTTVLVKYTLAGDADLNGLVDLDDFTRLAARFGTASYWSGGDFNYDRQTNLDDFTILAANFGLSIPADQPRGTVPEPLAALAPSLLLLLRRKPRGC